MKDKKEKCRYWPNCTLGSKCAFYHPEVLCRFVISKILAFRRSRISYYYENNFLYYFFSAFPTCKYGDKCAYKHPKCKFGISCTKLGCLFSHPPQQCKYHPFCTKPGCPFTHPPAVTATASNVVDRRAKFTWKRQD